jgi:hypothetical protein
MSVYKKLIEARNILQTKQLTKSGHNKFAGYKYFELGDFLPEVQKIFKEVGLVDIISFDAELATMSLYDVDGGSWVTFTSPMGSAALKGCHEVQNIGAVETYQRRYLYTTAMAIVEHDALDATTGAVEPAKKPEVKVKPIEYSATNGDLKIKMNDVPVPKVDTKPIVGQKGEFQIVINAKPDCTQEEWLALVRDSSHMLLDLCSSDADVMTIFKKNKVLFDTVKAKDPEFFKEMMGKFTETKNKFAKE